MLKGKSAIVTGSTSGIGKAVANSLAEAGCNIVINGFGDADEIETFLKEIQAKHNVKAIYSDADLSNPEAIKNMITKAKSTFKNIDILVNNAGIQHVDLIEDFPAEKWNLLIAVNLSAAYHTIASTVKDMKNNGFGRIINIASAHGLVASEKKAAYVASKHGIVGLTKVVALEAAGSGVTCNAICPGWVLTPLVEKQINNIAANKNLSFEEAKKELLLEKQPSGQFVKPEQVGAFVRFLCSNNADEITGAALSIDGGWTAR